MESLLERLEIAYHRASQGDERSATSLVAQFIGRILAAVRKKSPGTAQGQPANYALPVDIDDMSAFFGSVSDDTRSSAYH